MVPKPRRKFPGCAPLLLYSALSDWQVLLFAIAWGVAQGLLNIPMSVIWPNYYGRAHIGSIQGITTTATVLGSALGPILFGWAHGRFGNYDFVLLLSAAIWVAGGLLALLAPPPKRKRPAP